MKKPRLKRLAGPILIFQIGATLVQLVEQLRVYQDMQRAKEIDVVIVQDVLDQAQREQEARAGEPAPVEP